MPNKIERENLTGPEAQEAREQEPKVEEPVEIAPKRELVEHQLSPEDVGAFKGEMDEYTVGLQARVDELNAELADLKMKSAEFEQFARYREIQDELAELREQIDGLTDSSEAINEHGDNAIITIKA